MIGCSLDQSIPSIVLAVRPKYVEPILDLAKPNEYRRVAPSIDAPFRTWLYATAPISKIVGRARVPKVIRGTPAEIASRTATFPSSEDEILEYLDGGTSPAALRLTKVESIDPVGIRELLDVDPPQNFLYIQRPKRQTKVWDHVEGSP